jgi:hypothetical protein
MAMNSFRILLAACAASATLAACAHPGTQTTSGGALGVDSLSATRTAILRVQNGSASEVRVYTVLNGQANYVAKAAPGETGTVLLDPMLFPATSISFEARAADSAATGKVGPLKVNRGETIELVVPLSISQTRATIHKSTP